jgi:hypothetical protein
MGGRIRPMASEPALSDVLTILYQRGTMPKGHRTTHRSSTGKKLYAVRDAKGRFKDIQTYKRAHAADLKREAKREK